MDFCNKPNFQVSGFSKDDVLPCLENEDEIVLWNDSFYLGESRFLSEIYDTTDKYKGAKSRFKKFSSLVNRHPFISLIVAEALFFLDDLDGCRNHLLAIKQKHPDNPELNNILSNLNEIEKIHLEAEDDYFKYGHERNDQIDIFEFKSPFPCPFEPMNEHQMQEICSQWQGLQKFETRAMECFIRLACLSSNVLEDVFQVEGNSWIRLIRLGFHANSIEGISALSRMKKKATIVTILNNTLKALTQISTCVDDPSQFTPDFLMKLHFTMLEEDCFDEIQLDGGGMVIRLLKVGTFRKNRNIITYHNEGEDEEDSPTEMTQYCHYSDVASEMANFCGKVQELLRNENIDPFLTAAWIQWAFLRIHPFEDGNGRVSRIISTLPLYKSHLPPIVVKTEKKPDYFAALRAADRESNIMPLRNFLLASLHEGMEEIRNLPEIKPQKILTPKRRNIPGSKPSASDASSSSSQGSTPEKGEKSNP